MEKDELDVDEIPEVAALVAFDERHKEELERMRELLEERDILLQAASKAVRALGVSCGPFRKMSESYKINWEEAHELLGEIAFTHVGGTVERVAKYKGDKNMYMAAWVRREVPEQVDSQVRTLVRRYKVEE